MEGTEHWTKSALAYSLACTSSVALNNKIRTEQLTLLPREKDNERGRHRDRDRDRESFEEEEEEEDEGKEPDSETVFPVDGHHRRERDRLTQRMRERQRQRQRLMFRQRHRHRVRRSLVNRTRLGVSVGAASPPSVAAVLWMQWSVLHRAEVVLYCK